MTAVQSHISATFLNRKKKRGLLFVALIVLLVLVTMLSISLGQFTIPLSQLTGILAKGPMGASTLDETVVGESAFPACSSACSWALPWVWPVRSCRRSLPTLWQNLPSSA